jgi:Family of unknown function (DUF6152)
MQSFPRDSRRLYEKPKDKDNGRGSSGARVSGSLAGHHAESEFDGTRSVTVKGTIVLFERVNPHTFIFVDEKGKNGEMHRWAIAGPGIVQLTRMGIAKDALKTGDVIEACGYVTKEGVPSQRTVSTEPRNISGQLLSAELVVTPDGKERKWSDYGHHKCLGSGYQDFHSR